MTTRLSTMPLDMAAMVVAYNIYHTHMVAADAQGTVAVWRRPDPPSGPASWEKMTSWTVDGKSTISCLCWAPPEFGNVVCGATGSGSVYFWTQDGKGDWSLRTCIQACNKPATCVRFRPAAFGPWVAVGFEDGSVRFFEASSALNAEYWELQSSLKLDRFPTSSSTSVPQRSVTSISWREEHDDCPPLIAVGTSSETFPCEIWMFCQERLLWERIKCLGLRDIDDAMEDGDSNGNGHKSVGNSHDRNGNKASDQAAGVVAWAPTLGRPFELLAVGTKNLVTLWSLLGRADSLQVERVADLEHEHTVWQLEWNMLGNFLAASTDGGEVCLWRPDFGGEWILQNKICAGDTNANHQESMNTE